MSLVTLVVACNLLIGPVAYDLIPKNSSCKSTFILEIKKSDMMKSELVKLVCTNAIAVTMHRGGRFQYRGIDIFFAPQTADGHLPKSTKEIQLGDYTNLNLLTDTANRVTQVNMTVVRPGKTISRTIAWNHDDLKKYFSNVTLTSHRVVLRSSGKYDEAETESTQVTLRWDVDIDILVTDEPAN